MIRIALVNDMRMAIEALRRVVEQMSDACVAWTALDGQQAIDQCRNDRPDLILMDLIMPNVDGVEATRQIMQHSPCPILVVTATVSGNSNKVFEALGHGAVDAVNTPAIGRDGSLSGAAELVKKIRTVVKLQGANAAAPLASATPTESAVTQSRDDTPLVVIGASTGGPQAIATVLSALQRPVPYAIIVVQHLDAYFVPSLAEWLGNETRLPVKLVAPGDRPERGIVHLASTNDHLILRGNGTLDYTKDPESHVYRPSVDVLFMSIVRSQVKPGIALLLTGMGRDGAAGLKSLRDAGWRTIAQDRETSVVWGMPGAAVKLDAAEQVLPLNQIATAIAACCHSRYRRD